MYKCFNTTPPLYIDDFCSIKSVNAIRLYRQPTRRHDIDYNGHFPRQLRQVGTILDITGAKDDGGGGDNWSYKTCKSPVKSSPQTKPTPSFIQTGCPSCRPTNSVRALKVKVSHSTDLVTPSSRGVFHPRLRLLKAAERC